MRQKLKKILRPALFALGGALLGLAYYYVVGCPDGACAITSSPINSMLYVGVIALLFSSVAGGDCCGSDQGSCQR